METKFQMVAKTFQGLEDVLRDELIALGAENVELGNRMVTFEGDKELMYRANLCCRTALRILKPIVKFTADSTDELYDYVRDLDWEQFMNVDSTFSIDSTVNSSDFNHSKFVTYRVKDAIADHFNDKYGRRPSIRLVGADLQLNVHISDNRVTISLDSSGEPLSKRGYRLEQTEAPINEVLAAGIIMKTGWRGDSDFVDPMCGSGTFLIEAALIAANINPGIYRESFAFEKWPDYDADLFEEIYNDDSAEREFGYKIYGGDISPEAVSIARKNIRNARVDDMVEIVCQSVSDWIDNAPEGVLVTNPPYGERLKPENINLLYKTIGSTLKNYFKGWHAWIIGYRDEQFAEIGLKPSVKIPLHNGSLECSLREYVLFDGRYSDFRADGGSVSNPDAKKESGPKKVRHISDDDWEKQARKFNSGKGIADDRNKKKKSFNRDDKKRSYDSAPARNYSPGFDDDDERGGFRPRPQQKRDERPSDRGNSRPGGNNSRPGGFGKGGFGKGDRDNNRPGGYGKDGFNKGGYGKGDRDNNRQGGYGKGGFNKGGYKNERKEYVPGSGRRPGLPESSAEIINPVHMRQRKGWKKDSEE